MSKKVALSPEQHSYLTTNSKCSHESFYDCMSRIIADILRKSSSQCWIFSLPNIRVCKKYDKTIEEINELFDVWIQAIEYR